MNKISYKISTEMGRVWRLQNENYRICIYAVNINTVKYAVIRIERVRS